MTRPGPYDGDDPFVRQSADWLRAQNDMKFLRTFPPEDYVLDGIPVKVRARCVLISDQDTATQARIAAKYGVTEGYIKL